MAKFDDKVNGNTVDADEYNNIVRASKNLIEDSGQTIDATNTQQSKAVAGYVGSGNFYTDSGSANTYVLSNVGSFRAPDAYTDGMEIRFRAGNASTAASTVNVGGLGVKNIKLADGVTDISTEITTDSDVRARYDGTNFRLSMLESGDMVKISSATASTSATIEFTDLSSDYIAYKVIIVNAAPSLDTQELRMKTSSDNGSTFDSGSTDYGYVVNFARMNNTPNFGTNGQTNNTRMQLSSGGIGNAADESYSGEVTIFDPSATSYTICTWKGVSRNNAGEHFNDEGSGIRKEAALVNAIQFLMSTGDIASGTFTLYGIKA